MSNILEINSLSKSYDQKKYALCNCSFNLKFGKICAVVGESGCGKTTLLRLIAGLERPNGGSIKIKGKIVSNDKVIVSPQKRSLGIVFQDFTLFPHLTVAQNIAFGLKENKEEKAKKLLKLIKMEEYAKVYPSTLSGGQEQRVAIARTLALNPELLLLDEPFSNLDSNLKSELRQEIRQIVKSIGTTMIFITHDFVDAIDIADEIILLKNGKMIEHSPIDKLSENADNKEVEKMIEELKNNAEKIMKVLK